MGSQQLFLLVWFIIVITLLTIMYIRGRKALEIFPNLDSVSLLFREKGVSGKSNKSILTKLGGANNILDVILTKDELWVRCPLLFAGFGKTYDLLHKVKLNSIHSAELIGNNVVVAFKAENGFETTLDLRIKKAQDFIYLVEYSKRDKHDREEN